MDTIRFNQMVDYSLTKSLNDYLQECDVIRQNEIERDTLIEQVLVKCLNCGETDEILWNMDDNKPVDSSIKCSECGGDLK